MRELDNAEVSLFTALKLVHESMACSHAKPYHLFERGE